MTSGGSEDMSKLRQVVLLNAAADALFDGRDPFSHDFLAENDVTLGEVYVLGELIGLGARVVAWGLEHPEQVTAAFNGAQLQDAYERLRAGIDEFKERR